MSTDRSLSRACRIASLPLVLAASAGAQTVVGPMTTLRLTIGGEKTTARVLRSDSASLEIEKTTGERRTIARADITGIQRRISQAKRGALLLGGVGAALGALAGVALVEGLCETSDCSDDIVPAMLVVGAYFGGIGAIGGAVIGHLAGQWRPMDRDVDVRQMGPVVTCLARPRFEGRLLRSSGMNGAGQSQFSVGAVCGSGTVIGVETGSLQNAWLLATSEAADPQFGTVVTTRTTVEKVTYRGAFLERPLTTGRVRLAALLSFGEYRDDSRWHEDSYLQPQEEYVDYQAFHQAHPHRWADNRNRQYGANVGAKASIALGTQVSAGFAMRLHRVGSEKQRVESGLGLSFRP
jgi:hypothetical protein